MLARLALLAVAWATHCISASAIRIDTADVRHISLDFTSADAGSNVHESLEGQLLDQAEGEAPLDRHEDESFVQIFSKKSALEKKFHKLKKKFLKTFNKSEWKKYKWETMVPALEAKLGRVD
ncbi:hypothetical protein ACSSS7_003580 [Eimeria intestinalis]